VTPRQVIQEINDVITRTISASLSNQQNYPALRKTRNFGSEIYIQGSPDLSISMRNLPYEEIYMALDKAGAFNIRMIDGALIQMCYTFSRNRMISHRLCVFPSPFLRIFEAAEEEYERDELFADIVERYVVRVPLRFDFSDDPEEHVDVHHPKSHLTLGQYSGCRIPVISPVTPTRFMRFVIRNFYNPALSKMTFDRRAEGRLLPETITANERQIAFFTS
jgi:hypothetical protein